MLMVTNTIVQLLEFKRSELRISKRVFAISYLDITEDTYSNWLNQFPSRPTKKARKKIMELLELTESEFDQFNQ